MSPLRGVLLAALVICLAGLAADTRRLYLRLRGQGLPVRRGLAIVPGHLMRVYLADCSARGRRPELRLLGPRSLWSAGVWISLVALLYAP